MSNKSKNLVFNFISSLRRQRERERDREKREKEKEREKERKCTRHVSDFSFELGIPVAVCETFSYAFVVV